MKLSVLDQSPIRSGSNAAEAIEETVRLAQAADRRGYPPYWLAQHLAAARGGRAAHITKLFETLFC